MGVEITPDTPAETLREIAAKHEVEVDPVWDAEKLVIELFGETRGANTAEPDLCI